MVTERAIVVRYQHGRAELAVQRANACAHCELAAGCGTGAIGRLLGDRRKPIIIDTDRPLNPGDLVTLGLSERAVVKASLLLYGLPLIGLVVFSVITQSVLALPEWTVVLAAAAGLWFGFEVARQAGARMAQDSFSIDVVDVRMNPERLPES